MNPTVWLIRGQDRHGWSDYPAIYGDTFTSKEAALSLANKLMEEGKTKNVRRHIAVYECTIVWEQMAEVKE